MTPPVKKEQGEYFVSAEYHLLELQKYEKEIEILKQIISRLRKENKELEKTNQKTKEQIVMILKSIT